MDFKLISSYEPTGDQPQAIKSIVDGLNSEHNHITLEGVTGSGKTFTMANVIKEIGRPTLVLSHNKTLAAQLYSEFKAFFPENSVQFFISYYDYYQPEAYMPQTDTYIEKDLAINDEIEKMRLSTTSALLSGRNDIIVVASVSCLYGIGNPEDFEANTLELRIDQKLSMTKLLQDLTNALYCRSEIDFKPGCFRIKGDTIDIHPAYGDTAYRIRFDGNMIESISSLDPVSMQRIESMDRVFIHPANIFVTTKERTKTAIRQIEDDLTLCVEVFRQKGLDTEGNRLKNRTEYDLEMIREVGYCSGIENYSRYFDGRKPGSRPFCLLDYFPKDFITFVDESHVTVGQIKAMIGGDRSRKANLVEYGFRLPAAFDNRPLTLQEFELLTNKVVYVSATPMDYELQKSEGLLAEQIIRPTGLLDPLVEVRKTNKQIDVVLEEINKAVEVDERVIITTLTKRMAEELTKFLEKANIRCRYIHSDIDSMERVELLEDFRKGLYDVLVGVNLLREGIDVPQVALVMIMDADKEGMLRSERSLIQTAGRAARNVNGRVILFADKHTESMRKMMQKTKKRRALQMKYNEEHGITPQQTQRASNTSIITGKSIVSRKEQEQSNVIRYDTLARESLGMVAEGSVVDYFTITKENIEADIEKARSLMEEAARKQDFLTAMQQRDKMLALQDTLKKLKK